MPKTIIKRLNSFYLHDPKMVFSCGLLTTITENTDQSSLLVASLCAALVLFSLVWLKNPTIATVLPEKAVSPAHNILSLFPEVQVNPSLKNLFSIIPPVPPAEVTDSYLYTLTFLYQLSTKKIVNCQENMLMGSLDNASSLVSLEQAITIYLMFDKMIVGHLVDGLTLYGDRLPAKVFREAFVNSDKNRNLIFQIATQINHHFSSIIPPHVNLEVLLGVDDFLGVLVIHLDDHNVDVNLFLDVLGSFIAFMSNNL